MTEAFSTLDQRWEAVLNRNPQAEGYFWYGVTSTKIFCRPSCPSRRPKRENVRFFKCLDEAKQAGFRSCKRCKPDQVQGAVRAVAQAQALLDTAETEPKLADLAAHVGLSPYYLQRLFKQHMGVSPKQYFMRQRTERLKRSLKEGHNVTTALYDAGHDSPSTLYAASTDQLGMLPKVYANGGVDQEIHFVIVKSQLGPMLVAATTRGLCSVQFGDATELKQALLDEFSKAQCTEDAQPLQHYIQALHDFLAGQNNLDDLPTDAKGTEFQERVWNALRKIPHGETRTYSEIAEAIGQPQAVRAVARACATNPVALIVPCHRVVRKGGQLSGYRWGVERKKEILALEAKGCTLFV